LPFVKVIRVNGDDDWLYGAVDPETTKYCSSSRFKRRRNRRNQLDHVEFLVDNADYLVNVLDEDGYRFQMISRGNRNGIERVF